MFRKVLVANRGEIAVRIIRACRELDVATVAVYSEADAEALHTVTADEAHAIGPAPAHESYLRGDRLIEVAQKTGAQAIHPGYGFLSEDAAFARACADAGLVFVGPPPEAMEAMAEKTAARALMERSGVPVVPGAPAGSDRELIAAAPAVGYPLLVKAAAGGGGKGMRVVNEPAELPAALRAARGEGARSFGSDAVYLERFLERPRHVEVQVLGLATGEVVHLFERECSLQRRHQKVVEESPSPALSAGLRARLCAAAVRAAEAVGYAGAGTVEFLLDRSGAFYFLEMNTRLQVEHPITELVTGVDLVKAQLRIAAGESVGFEGASLRQRGHAIECRVYAEDPERGFAPQAGAVHYADPPLGPHVRVDAGVQSGCDVPIHYDPLLAKVICWGETRIEAIRTAREALRRYVILGPVTNVEYLIAVLCDDAFEAGDTHTAFLDERFGSWRAPDAVPQEVLVAAALADHLGVGTGASTTSGLATNEGSFPADDRYSPWRGAYALGPR